MMSCCIDAKEGRYVVVTDILGAFLHADMNECVHMIMEGTVAEHIAKLEPTIYRKYIWHDKKGKPMLYIRQKKALYGTLQAALLFWQLLSDTLTSWGFTINPYDQCVANKQINGKQCTTQDMIADFFTKPLQGSLFVRMHERILNLPASKIASVHRSVLEERGSDSNKGRRADSSKYKVKKNDGKEDKQDSVTRIKVEG